MRKQLRTIVVDGKEYGWNRNGLVRERLGKNPKTGKNIYGKSYRFKPENMFKETTGFDYGYRAGAHYEIRPVVVANWIRWNIR